MGFVKDVAKAGLSPALALMTHKKKKPVQDPSLKPMITLSNRPVERTSLIGSQRGMF